MIFTEEINMSWTSIMSLFGAMIVLAALPSTSVLTVIARSVAFGFVQGAGVALGVVLGDVFLIAIAVLGLSVLAEMLGSLFILVKYVGGIYLIWLGADLLKLQPKSGKVKGVLETSLLSSFLAGLFITLGDVKAILFYLGFFPAFLDLSTLSSSDVWVIMCIAVIAVGGIKLGYAYMAGQTVLLVDAGKARKMNIAAGSIMIVVGVWMLVQDVDYGLTPDIFS